MLTITYYRGWLSQYKQRVIIKNLINEVENADIVIAPIADNRMFDLISEFIDSSIINEQCEYALATTNLEK